MAELMGPILKNLRTTSCTQQIVHLAANACFQSVSAPRGCTKDEGRSLEASLQERASNHLKLQW